MTVVEPEFYGDCFQLSCTLCKINNNDKNVFRSTIYADGIAQKLNII